MSTAIKLNTIIVEKVIVHSIPKHAKDDLDIEPTYSELESTLSDGLKLFFKDKIVQALGSHKSFKICFNDASDSPVSYVCAEVIGNKGVGFVEHSKVLAKRLFEIQMGSNAPGILVFIYGTVNGHGTCFLLKLEMDKGMQLHLDPKTNSYDIAEVENLMLTQKTKIFKVAMFVLRADFKTKYDGQIMDYQIDIKSKKEVSTWFMDRFLGCVAFEDPKITTQIFYNLTRSYIDTLEEPIEKAKYLQDLNSYVQKNSGTLSGQEFADDYLLETERKSGYEAFLKSKNFTLGSFLKNTTQIDNQVKKIMITFENDISIIGNKGILDEKVKLQKLSDGQTRAEITSKIKKVV